MKNNQLMVLNLQRFAETETTAGTATAQNQNAEQSGGNNQQPVIDYNKIQGMIDSRNQRNEEAVLKGYFQSQGLSEEEMKNAISTYKAQKVESSKQQEADNIKLKADLESAQQATLKANIEKEAYIQAIELGIAPKSIPYVTKLADFANVVDDKGNITNDAIKTALQKVLDDVPGFKKDDQELSNLKIGADSSQSNASSLDSTLSKIFGTKK